MGSVEKQNQSSERRTKVLIVDDHPVVLEGLAHLINKRKDMVVCGCAQNIPDAIKAIKTLKPDVVTVDISLGDANGLDLVKEIKTQFPHVRILVLSMHEEPSYAERALRAGAGGYIMKKEAGKNVALAIRSVLNGELYLSEGIKNKLLSSALGLRDYGGSDSPVNRLSAREMEVFRLLGEAKGTHEIAECLGVSVKTVETYRARIKEKLHLSSTSKLLQQAFAWTRA